MRYMMGAQPLDADQPRGPLGLFRLGLTALLLALSLAGLTGPAGAQEEPIPTLETLAEGPVPAEVGEQVAWRLVRDTAEPEGEANG